MRESVVLSRRRPDASTQKALSAPPWTLTRTALSPPRGLFTRLQSTLASACRVQKWGEPAGQRASHEEW